MNNEINNYVENILELGKVINLKDKEIGKLQTECDNKFYRICELQNHLYHKVEYSQKLEFEIDSYKLEIAKLHKEIKSLNQKLAIKNKIIESTK